MGYVPCQEVQNLSLQHAILALKGPSNPCCAGQNAVQLQFIGSNKTLRTCVPNQIIESNRFSSREPIKKTAKRQTWAMGPIAVPKSMFFLKRGKHRQTIPFWWSLAFGFQTFSQKQPAKNHTMRVKWKTLLLQNSWGDFIGTWPQRRLVVSWKAPRSLELGRFVPGEGIPQVPCAGGSGGGPGTVGG